MSRLLILLPLAALAVAVAVALPGAATSAEGTPAGITVSGSGVVEVVPDTARLSFGVSTDGATARAAIAANGSEMRAVLAALRAAGATELKTQAVSLSPRRGADGERDGFSAWNVVGATTDIARVGAVIDAAVDAGAGSIYGPSFSIGERAELYRRALRAAVSNARASAQTLASAAGLSLGRITAITEQSRAPATATASVATGSSSSTPVEPGTQQVTAGVTVTFSVS